MSAKYISKKRVIQWGVALICTTLFFAACASKPTVDENIPVEEMPASSVEESPAKEILKSPVEEILDEWESGMENEELTEYYKDHIENIKASGALHYLEMYYVRGDFNGDNQLDYFASWNSGSSHGDGNSILLNKNGGFEEIIFPIAPAIMLDDDHPEKPVKFTTTITIMHSTTNGLHDIVYSNLPDVFYSKYKEGRGYEPFRITPPNEPHSYDFDFTEDGAITVVANEYYNGSSESLIGWSIATAFLIYHMVYDGETPAFDKVYVVRKNQIVGAYCNEDFVPENVDRGKEVISPYNDEDFADPVIEILNIWSDGQENADVSSLIEERILDKIQDTVQDDITARYIEYDFNNDGKEDYFIHLTFQKEGESAEAYSYIMIATEDGFQNMEIPFIGTCFLDSEVSNVNLAVMSSSNEGFQDLIFADPVNVIYLRYEGASYHAYPLSSYFRRVEWGNGEK